tara:strand:+ start:2243 stop:3565 length:1323 start_codon:yes stop_codon:yes gene_type:complete
MKSYRKSSRSYNRKKIKFSVIKKIIEDATNYSPSSCNHQMWHFTAVDDESLKRKLAKISGQSHFEEASWIIIITTHLGWNHNKFSVIQSAAAATQMIIYYADLKDIVGCWNAGVGNTDEIRKILSIDSKFEIIGALTLGLPGDQTQYEIKPSKRNIEDILSRNKFERPLHSQYPLKDFKKIIFWKGMNSKNIYSIHNPKLWSIEQICNFRSFSVFAKSPFPKTYISKRFKSEINEELFGSKLISNIFSDEKSSLKILEILPFGGTYTNFLALSKKNSITLAEYSENNFKYVNSRIRNQGFNKLNFLQINKYGKFFKYSKYDIIYCLQSIEEVPNQKILLSEINKASKGSKYIIFSIRNILSWYGLFFYLVINKSQVPNFGPHIPLNPFKTIFTISKIFSIKEIYGISPFPKKSGVRVNHPFLKYFCRLIVIICTTKNASN